MYKREGRNEDASMFLRRQSLLFFPRHLSTSSSCSSAFSQTPNRPAVSAFKGEEESANVSFQRERKKTKTTHLLETLPVKVRTQPPDQHLSRSSSSTRIGPAVSTFRTREVLEDLRSDIRMSFEIFVERKELASTGEDVLHTIPNCRRGSVGDDPEMLEWREKEGRVDRRRRGAGGGGDGEALGVDLVDLEDD